MAPVVDDTHPASSHAPESRTKSMPRMLAIDEPTQRTRDLLAQRAAQARAAEEASPAESAVIPKPATTPSHEHQH